MSPSTDRWQEFKAEHRALSAAAAEHYDELYETANFATGSYMRYELETIRTYTPQAPTSHLALDLGCGTGRDSFLLAKFFDHVYAYDFAPEMIDVANRNKLAKRVGNVLFDTRDIEDGPLPLANESISFVNTAFGMGSFVRQPEVLFREVRRVLLPRGLALFSFYNADALVNRLPLEWKPALAARVIPGEDVLQVDFEGRSYRIAAKAYSHGLIVKRLEQNFRILAMTTFPTLSALFPQPLFDHESARKLCSNVDQLLASNLEIAAGPYIVAVCRKGGEPVKDRPLLGYERVLELLRLHAVPLDLREHRPVRSMADVREVLEARPGQMVKSVLMAFTASDGKDPEDLSAELFLVGLPADRRLSLGKLAAVLAKPRERLRLATQIEVETLTGFKVGSIPPFGVPKNVPVILDTRLAQEQVLWCGTGKATESLRLSISDLKRLSACSVHDVSKE